MRESDAGVKIIGLCSVSIIVNFIAMAQSTESRRSAVGGPGDL